MNIIFIGIQGSGKGTQAKEVAKELSLANISTGELLRNTTGDLGEQIHEFQNDGVLVPDNLTIQALQERIIQDDCENGIILDGFPRNINQAEALSKKMEIHKVIEIKISDEEAMKRLSGRFSCRNCKTGYNTNASPKPQKEGICDKCEGELIQRKDDTPKAIQERINTYHKLTEPLLDYYKDKLTTINGEQSIKVVEKDILKILN